MAFGFHTKRLLLLVLIGGVSCTVPPRGAIEIECRDRYMWMSIDLAFAASTLRIDALDDAGAHPLAEEYGSECGYSYNAGHMGGRAVLRASYFSCHTRNQDDRVFLFRFNFVMADDYNEGKTCQVSKRCTQLLPWSPREVVCEENYMEVSVATGMSCTPIGESKPEVWNASLSVVRESAVSVWQVMFLTDGQLLTPMSVGDARKLGYVITTTVARVVFRSAFRQPHSKIIKVNGVLVETIHAVVFFRRKWMVTMLDMPTACTANAGSFDGAHLFWVTPTVMTPLVYDQADFLSKSISMGVEGRLLDEYIADLRGYSLAVNEATVQIGIPFAAEGGYRRSFVMHNMYHEFYVIYLYYENLFTDALAAETRHRLFLTLSSPVLPRLPFTLNQTVLEENTFTVYLGNFPSDVALVAVTLNGQPFTVPEATQSGYTIIEVPLYNGTHAYVLRVPFENSIIPKMYVTEGIIQYFLDINYTLTIIPLEDPFYHLAFVMAQITNVFPPNVSGVCTENGIIFKVDQVALGYLWNLGVGHHPLTPELAARRGYIMQNDGRSLTLEVPVFTIGYTYENITLGQFFGTFEILLRDAKTLTVQRSTAKRCPFETNELIVCSTNGVMTLVTSIAAVLPVDLKETTLLDRTCKPRESEGVRVLFEFGVKTCGTSVTVDEHYVTYENEVLRYTALVPDAALATVKNSDFRLTITCRYEVSDINRQYLDRKDVFERPGFGTVKTSSTSAKCKR